jgi:hypothetical protein
VITAASYDAAFLAAGAVVEAVDAVLDGKVANAFCVTRPGNKNKAKISKISKVVSPIYLPCKITVYGLLKINAANQRCVTRPGSCCNA